MMIRRVAVLATVLLAGAVPARAAISGDSAVAACDAAAGALPPLADPPLNPPVIGAYLPSELLSQTGPRGCRTAQSFVWGAAAACRYPLRSLPDPAATGACTVVDGRNISEAQVAAYDQSWVHRALQLQAGIDADAPLIEDQIPHTHNSYNSSAYSIGSGYYPTLTNMDPNQVYTLTDQLNMDVRFLELDLHWVPSPYGNASTNGYWVTLCHGDSANPLGVHVGCTDDRPLEDGLAEIRRWTDAHPDQFVFIYFENQLVGNTQAHQIAGSLIDQAFDAGPHAPQIFKPPSTARCADMPLTTSVAAMKAAGAHLLIVGNCDAGNGQATQWGTLVHSRGPKWNEDGDPSKYGATACQADEQARTTEHNFRRFFGDDTLVAALLGHDQNITATTAAQMTRCGVNIIGFDQLEPFDGRLAALVWSWSATEALHPSGACALQQGSQDHDPGRFAGAPCASHHPFGCVDSGRVWHVTAATARWGDGALTCAGEFPGSVFGVPASGWRNQQLISATQGEHPAVWVNDRRIDGTWTATHAD
ncbi:MAG: PI-PLC domain-containing protein [Acidimicrobiales bacterium]